MEKFNLKSGFTLLELLVVIAIIGILASVGAVSFSSVQQKTRDTRRAADIKVIQNAMEQFYTSNVRYPTSGESCNPGVNFLPGGMPKDPKTGLAYQPTCNAQGSIYCICASLENIGGGNSTDGNCTFGTGAFQCAKNLQ